MRAEGGAVPGTAYSAAPLRGQGRGGQPGSSGFLDREAQEAVQRFPEKPRRAHGAPDLARCPRPAEPRLQEKGRILPAEGTRCVGGMPPPRWPSRHCSTRAPHRRPGGGKGRSPRPLPVPRRHECLLRPKVLGNRTLGLRGQTRSRLRPGSAGPAAKGGSGLGHLARAAALGWGLQGAPAASGTLPAATSGAARGLSSAGLAGLQRWATAAQSALSELLGRREGRLAGLGSRGDFGGGLAAGPSRGGVL